MDKVVLVIHLILALSLIVLVLVQRSEGGGLGMGGGSGGIGNVASARGTANVLTRATSICFALFVVTSMTLAIFAGQAHRSGSVIDALDAAAPAVKQEAAPDAGTGTAPEAPAPGAAPVETPKVPISQ